MVAVREDMVKRAVSFLRHPKVKHAPREEQITFLKDKSLTSEEIEEALRKAAELEEKSSTTTATSASAPVTTKRFRKGPVRSEAVVAGGMVYVSGQTGFPPGEEGDDAVNAEEQTTKALEKVQTLLEEAGSSSAKVVSALLCVRDLGEDLEGVDKAWGRWIDTDNPPARTVVQRVGGGGGGSRVVVQVTAHL